MNAIYAWISENGIDWTIKVAIALLILIVGKIAARIISNLVQKALRKSSTDDMLIKFTIPCPSRMPVIHGLAIQRILSLRLARITPKEHRLAIKIAGTPIEDVVLLSHEVEMLKVSLPSVLTEDKAQPTQRCDRDTTLHSHR